MVQTRNRPAQIAFKTGRTSPHRTEFPLTQLASLQDFDLSFSKAAFDIERRFATPFVVAPLTDCSALNAALLPTIMDKAAHHPGVRLSNDGGWQSTDDFTAWSGPAGAATPPCAWPTA